MAPLPSKKIITGTVSAALVVGVGQPVAQALTGSDSVVLDDVLPVEQEGRVIAPLDAVGSVVDPDESFSTPAEEESAESVESAESAESTESVESGRDPSESVESTESVESGRECWSRSRASRAPSPSSRSRALSRSRVGGERRVRGQCGERRERRVRRESVESAESVESVESAESVDSVESVDSED